MKRILGILALMALCFPAARAASSDLIGSRTVLEDKTGTMTLAEVVHREGTPFGHTLATNGAGTVLWVRLQVHAPAQGSKVVLYILPTYVHEVRLYEAGPGDPSQWPTRVTGNLYPYAQRDRVSTALGFVVNVTAPETTYYLRLANCPLLFSVEAMSPEEAIAKDHRRDLLVVFFLTSMLGLLLWAVHAYYLDREPVVGLFALHQVVYTLFGFVHTGYLAPISSARFPYLADWMGNLLYLLINFTIVLFCRELFKPYNPPAWALRLFSVFLWAFPVLLILGAAGYTNAALLLNALLIRTTWVYLVVIVFLLRTEAAPKRRLVQIFFIFIWLNNLAFWYVNHGSLPIARTDLGMLQILVVDGLLIGGMFALMLHARIRQKLREGYQSALDLQRVQQRFEIEQEQKRQIEVQAHTDYLTGLSNRRHFLALAQRELTLAISFHRPLTLLLIDVDYFKRINDTLGHRAGDTALQKIAGVLRDVVRKDDILGRIGGEEFAVMMVGMEGEPSVRIAQRLCTAVMDAEIAQDGAERIPVTISIGLTQLRGRNMDFSSLMEEADQALYRAKHAGRNQVFVSSEPPAGASDARPTIVVE